MLVDKNNDQCGFIRVSTSSLLVNKNTNNLSGACRRIISKLIYWKKEEKKNPIQIIKKLYLITSQTDKQSMINLKMWSQTKVDENGISRKNLKKELECITL